MEDLTSQWLSFIPHAVPATLSLSVFLEYSVIFNDLDPGSSGSLSRDDLVIALRLAGHNPTRDEIDQLLVHKQGNLLPLIFSSVINRGPNKRDAHEKPATLCAGDCYATFLLEFANQ